MRSLAREVVFKFIFSRLFNPEDEGLFDVLCKNEKLSVEDSMFARDLLSFCNENYDFYLETISNLSKSFKINRIFSADKCAIILGMAELDNFPDTPKPVVVNEAVNLASKYSTEKSTNFVNGILAGYLLEKENKNG